MKKIIGLLAIVLVFALVSCEHNEYDPVKTSGNGFILKGNVAPQTKTSFGTPADGSIPFLWDKDDVIIVNEIESAPLAEGGTTAEFSFTSGSVSEGDEVYYGYWIDNKVWTLPVQTGAVQGIDGDFGYAVIDSDNSFTLEHYTSYIWLDTYSSDVNQKVTKVVLVATNDIAGAADFNTSDKTFGNISPIDYSIAELINTKSIEIEFKENPKSLLAESSDEEIWAVAVTFPVTTGKFRIDYYFEDGSVASYKYPSNTLQPGRTYKISQNIQASDLKQYDFKVLTFEDEDFTNGICTPYENNFYVMDWSMFEPQLSETREVTSWSEFIPLLTAEGYCYGNGHGLYSWKDNGNTNLQFVCPGDNPNQTGFFGISGHAGISRYYTTDYETYGNYLYDLMAYNVTGGANGSANFCTHYGYMDPEQYDTGYGPQGSLPGISFSDGIARVIDHMYVTHTAYGYKVLVNGETQFGGTYELNDEALFKIVAYGYESEEDTDPTSAEFYLLAPGQFFAEGWCKWDLSILGKVVKVEFNLIAGSTGYGQYGNMLPAYFAYDDVAVRFEE